MTSMAAKPYYSTYMWASISGAWNLGSIIHYYLTVWNLADALPTELYRLGCQSTIVPHLELVTSLVRKVHHFVIKFCQTCQTLNSWKSWMVRHHLSSCRNNEHHLAGVNRLKLIGSDIYWTAVWYCLLSNWHKAGMDIVPKPRPEEMIECS